MPPPLPYPKPPRPPKIPTALTGLPKYKRLFDSGPKPIQPPPNPLVDRIRPAKDYGPMSSRSSYIRYLKGERADRPDSMATQLLQVLQGGGRPLKKTRADMLRRVIQGWLGEGY